MVVKSLQRCFNFDETEARLMATAAQVDGVRMMFLRFYLASF